LYWDPTGESVYKFDEEGELIFFEENDEEEDEIFTKSGTDENGESIFEQLDQSATKEFLAIVVGESSNDKEEAEGIANVMLNRMAIKGAKLEDGFVSKIDNGKNGNSDYDAIGGKQYNLFKEKSLKDSYDSGVSDRIKGGMKALSPLTSDNTKGAVFWNATSQKDAANKGWNWKQYEAKVYSKTVELGETTFFRYNSNKTENPTHYKCKWP